MLVIDLAKTVEGHNASRVCWLWLRSFALFQMYYVVTPLYTIQINNVLKLRW